MNTKIMNTKINKHELFKKHYHKIILYEFIEKRKSNNLNYHDFGKVKKNDYINSIYFVGLFYLQNLIDNIDIDCLEIMKQKFFDKYYEYFLRPIPDKTIETIKSINIQSINHNLL